MFITRTCLYILSLLDILIALAFVAFGIILCIWFNGPPSFNTEMFNTVDGFVVALFILFILSGMVGIEGLYAASRAYEGLIWFFIFGSLVLTSFYLLFGIYPLENPQVTSQLSASLWNKIRASGRAEVQDWLNCCGYNSTSDRPADSAACPITITPGFVTNTTQPSCASTIQDLAGPNNLNWSICMFVFAFVSLLGVLFASRYLYVLKRDANLVKLQLAYARKQWNMQQKNQNNPYVDAHLENVVFDDLSPVHAAAPLAEVNRYNEMRQGPIININN